MEKGPGCSQIVKMNSQNIGTYAQRVCDTSGNIWNTTCPEWGYPRYAYPQWPRLTEAGDIFTNIKLDAVVPGQESCCLQKSRDICSRLPNEQSAVLCMCGAASLPLETCQGAQTGNFTLDWSAYALGNRISTECKWDAPPCWGTSWTTLEPRRRVYYHGFVTE